MYPYGQQGNNQPPYNSPPGPFSGPPQGQQNPPGYGHPYYPYPGLPMQPYPPMPPPEKKKGKALLIVLPILLVICSFSGWACANADFPLGDGVRITGVFAQQRLQATATYYANHYPFGTSVLFEDDFSTPSGKWRTSTNCANQGGALHVSEAKASSFYPCMSTYTPFYDSSGRYTYEITIKHMNANAAGLIFRGKSDEQYYHLFLIYADGTYALTVYDTLDKIHPYQKITSGKLMSQLGFPLRIGIVVIDHQKVGLYANGLQLTQVSDDNAGTTGDLGVAVFNNQGSQTAWADFVNAWCWTHRSDL